MCCLYTCFFPYELVFPTITIVNLFLLYSQLRSYLELNPPRIQQECSWLIDLQMDLVLHHAVVKNCLSNNCMILYIWSLTMSCSISSFHAVNLSWRLCIIYGMAIGWLLVEDLYKNNEWWGTVVSDENTIKDWIYKSGLG